MKNATFLGIGKSIGLKGRTLERYVEYMKTRWSKEEEMQCMTGYAYEWAERFLYKSEYNCSDSIGRSVLQKIDGEE